LASNCAQGWSQSSAGIPTIHEFLRRFRRVWIMQRADNLTLVDGQPES